MKKMLHVRPRDPIHEDGHVVLSATLDSEGDASRCIWYRIEERNAELLSRTSDHFLLGALYPAMQEGADILVHGLVSATLLRNLDEFQRAWQMWAPQLYRPANIFADEVLADVDSPRRGDAAEAIFGFSGGIDSCFTAYRHVKAVAVHYPRKVKAGVMVHGFDIPLKQPEMFDRAAAKSRELLSSLGLEMITVATNLREHVIEWPYSFGATLASTLMLFQGRFGQGLMAQGIGYGPSQYYVNGSSPAIDPLLSSGSMEIIPDAAGYGRLEKIDAMKDWPELRRLLRVCWQSAELDRNCCRCPKCIAIILAFRALGLGLPPCFEHDVSDEIIQNMVGIKDIHVTYAYGPMLEHLRTVGVDEPWIHHLERAIVRSRRVRESRSYKYLDYYIRRIKREIRDRFPRA